MFLENGAGGLLDTAPLSMLPSTASCVFHFHFACWRPGHGQMSEQLHPAFAVVCPLVLVEFSTEFLCLHSLCLQKQAVAAAPRAWFNTTHMQHIQACALLHSEHAVGCWMLQRGCMAPLCSTTVRCSAAAFCSEAVSTLCKCLSSPRVPHLCCRIAAPA